MIDPEVTAIRCALINALDRVCKNAAEIRFLFAELFVALFAHGNINQGHGKKVGQAVHIQPGHNDQLAPDGCAVSAVNQQLALKFLGAGQSAMGRARGTCVSLERYKMLSFSPMASSAG